VWVFFVRLNTPDGSRGIVQIQPGTPMVKKAARREFGSVFLFKFVRGASE